MRPIPRSILIIAGAPTLLLLLCIAAYYARWDEPFLYSVGFVRLPLLSLPFFMVGAMRKHVLACRTAYLHFIVSSTSMFAFLMLVLHANRDTLATRNVSNSIRWLSPEITDYRFYPSHEVAKWIVQYENGTLAAMEVVLAAVIAALFGFGAFVATRSRILDAAATVSGLILFKVAVLTLGIVREDDSYVMAGLVFDSIAYEVEPSGLLRPGWDGTVVLLCYVLTLVYGFVWTCFNAPLKAQFESADAIPGS